MPNTHAARWIARLVLAGALLVAGLVVPPTATAAAPKVEVSVSKHTATVGTVITVTVRIHLSAGRKLGKASLSWGDGTRTRITRLLAHPRHAYGTPGTFHIVAKVSDSKGARSRARTTTVVTAPSGSYSGVYLVGGGAGGVSFYVSSDGTAIQDVSAAVGVVCQPGGSAPGFELVVDRIPLAADGSFAVTVQRQGVFAGGPATFRQTFRGRIGGLDTQGAVKAAGSLVSEVTYNNGTTFTCTSGSLPWTASRQSQPTPQPADAPPSGSYSGAYNVPGGASPFSYYVTPDGRTIQDLSLVATFQCAPGNSSGGVQMVIDSLPVAADGSFSGTSTYQGVFAAEQAQFTLTVTGHFHGTSPQGIRRAAGSLVGTITYDKGGTSFTCTSDALPFSVTRDQQPTPQPTAVTAGDYSGLLFGAGTAAPLRFTVTADRTEVVNVAFPIAVACTPGAGAGFNVAVDAIPLAADGGLSEPQTAAGTFLNHPAQFTYVIRGHSHGTDKNGHPRFAGALRVEVTYDDGAPHFCSSDDMPWSATIP